MDSINLVIDKPYYIECFCIQDVKSWIAYCKEKGYRWSDKRSGVMGKNHKFKYLFLFKWDVWWTFKEWLKDIVEANATRIEMPKYKTNYEKCLDELAPFIKNEVVYWIAWSKTVKSVLSKYIKD